MAQNANWSRSDRLTSYVHNCRCIRPLRKVKNCYCRYVWLIRPDIRMYCGRFVGPSLRETLQDLCASILHTSRFVRVVSSKFKRIPVTTRGTHTHARTHTPEEPRKSSWMRNQGVHLCYFCGNQWQKTPSHSIQLHENMKIVNRKTFRLQTVKAR